MNRERLNKLKLDPLKYKEHLEKCCESQKLRMKKYPWKAVFHNINNRCGKMEGYFKVNNFISLEELEFLWYRDNASSMNNPSIDRIDSGGHYHIDNCRFIEMSENSRRANLGKTSNPKPVFQYDLDGKFIAEYKSRTEAQKITGIQKTNICAYIKGKCSHAGSYLWTDRKVKI